MIHPLTHAPLSQTTRASAPPLSVNWGWLHLTWWWNPPPYRGMDTSTYILTRRHRPIDSQDAIDGQVAQTPRLWHPARDLGIGPDGKLYGLDWLPAYTENDTLEE